MENHPDWPEEDIVLICKTTETPARALGFESNCEICNVRVHVSNNTFKDAQVIQMQRGSTIHFTCIGCGFQLAGPFAQAGEHTVTALAEALGLPKEKVRENTRELVDRLNKELEEEKRGT